MPVHHLAVAHLLDGGVSPPRVVERVADRLAARKRPRLDDRRRRRKRQPQLAREDEHDRACAETRSRARNSHSQGALRGTMVNKRYKSVASELVAGLAA
eukprot:2776258-Pleurochrysis_carterae.AAC.1